MFRMTLDNEGREVLSRIHFRTKMPMLDVHAATMIYEGHTDRALAHTEDSVDHIE